MLKYLSFAGFNLKLSIYLLQTELPGYFVTIIIGAKNQFTDSRNIRLLHAAIFKPVNGTFNGDLAHSGYALQNTTEARDTFTKTVSIYQLLKN